MGYSVGTVLSPDQEFRKEVVERITYWENRLNGEGMKIAAYYKKMLLEVLEEDAMPKTFNGEIR